MSDARIDFKKFHWLDVSAPSPEQLQELANRYKLSPTAVQDSLQPEHLPKFEEFDPTIFMILRVYDEDAKEDADTVQELTRKVAIFMGEGFLLTIHRKNHPYMAPMLDRWRNKIDADLTPEHILVDMLQQAVHSFDRPVVNCIEVLESCEMEIFGAGTQRKFRLQKGYLLKRKVSVFRRILRLSLDPVYHVKAVAEPRLHSSLQNVREQIDSLFFYCDEVAESMNSLLNLHVSLESQRTNEAAQRSNEVMRVLTIFSCFFLPINFVASIYGMNFEFIPETKWTYGYPFSLALMVGVVVAIYVWFWRRGWLK